MANLVGQQIDRYHITGLLGGGGMATVYKAYDSHLQTEVAIKFIRADMLDSSDAHTILQRFETEARKTARLTHPNIVRTIDYGEYQNMPYLVMVYLSGGTLRDKMGHPIPYQQAAHLLAPIARALEYAHQQNIIHRDVKPANILLTDAGQPMLSDFGVAKVLASQGTKESPLTATGVGIGTPEYMAPEQVMGLPIDARADIYSLGIVFFELLTGKRPFSADTPMAAALKQITEPLPSPKELVPNLPDQVEMVLLKALAKQPEERYQSMGDFATALECLAMGGLDAALATLHPPKNFVEHTTAATVQNAAAQLQTAQPTKVVAAPPAQTAAIPQALPAKKSSMLPMLILTGLGLLFIGALVVGGAILIYTKLRPSSARELQATAPLISDASIAMTATLPPPLTPIPTITITPLPTETPVPLPSDTPTIAASPTVTPLPGRETVPIEHLAPKIPWLPMEQGHKPAVLFMGFLTSQEPFNKTQVRRAFALAVDRQKLTGLAEGSRYPNAITATSLIPAEVLGRDLNRAIGLPYDPEKARALLAEAGYPDGAGFPQVTLAFLSGSEEQKIATALAEMWKEVLNVNIQFKPTAKNQYLAMLSSKPPHLYLLAWAADYMDPHNFMNDLFRDANFGKFSEPEFEALLEQAAKAVAEPARRQQIYIQAEWLLCDQEAGVVPLYHYQAK